MKYDLPLIDNPGPNQPGPCDNGTTGNWVDWERICVLDATPVGYLVDDGKWLGVSPWEGGVWTDFLEYTCRWAFGATTSDDTSVKMTEGIHQSKYAPLNRLLYDPSNSNYWAPNEDPANLSIFELTRFLDDIGIPTLAQGRTAALDCRDFSGLLQLALSTHGLYSSCAAYKVSPQTWFTTWPLCPAGSDPSVTGPANSGNPAVSGNYASKAFWAHMLVHINESTFDASNAYYYDNWGFLWAKTPYFWSLTSLWQNSSSPFFGLAYRFTTGVDGGGGSDFFSFWNLPIGTNSHLITPQIVPGYKPTFVKDIF